MPPQTNKQSKQRHPVRLLLILLSLSAGLGLLNYNRQSIYDEWRLHGYNEPAAMVRLADQDTMTPKAAKIYAVNHPTLLDVTPFHQSCPNGGGEQTIVLGCYISDQQGIYLLNVTDERLNGVQQVTAAHEMLHAAYDRLNNKERDKVDAMLLDFYKNDLHDARIIKTIDAYKKSEPNDVVNEMHSIFGTEITSLPTGLESYYSQYFTKRSVVATFANTYQQEFTSRQDAIVQDDAQLATWKTQIDEAQASLKQQLADINAEQAQLNQLRNSDVSSYNAAVPGYNRKVDAYNSASGNLRRLINSYNDLVNTRNSIALQEGELVRALSGTAPATINK